MDPRTALEAMTPVPVIISNTAELVTPPKGVKVTTAQTWIVDPANPDVESRRPQIAAYEPARIRLVIEVIDAAVALCTEKPKTSPDASTASTAPQGRYLPVSTFEKVFYGPDAFWLNALSAVTRVTVTKEYC